MKKYYKVVKTWYMIEATDTADAALKSKSLLHDEVHVSFVLQQRETYSSSTTERSVKE